MKRFLIAAGMFGVTVLPASAQYAEYGPTEATSRVVWNNPSYWSQQVDTGPKPVQTVRVTASRSVSYTASSASPASTAAAANPTYTEPAGGTSYTASHSEIGSASYGLGAPSPAYTGPTYTSYRGSTDTAPPSGVTYTATDTETYTATYTGSTNAASAGPSYTAVKEWDTPTSRGTSIHRILSYGSDGSMKLAATEHDGVGDVITSSVCGLNQYGWSDCLNQAGEHYQLKPSSISYLYSLAAYR